MALPIYDFLFADPDPETQKVLHAVAEAHRWSYLSVTDGREALSSLEKHRFRVIVVPLDLPGFSGLQILEWVKTIPMNPEVIILSKPSSQDAAARALKRGAFNCLQKPLLDRERVFLPLRQTLQKHNLAYPFEEFHGSETNPLGFDALIGQSPHMEHLFEMIRTVAASDSNVLILGESGTGKELIANAIHRHGPRRSFPFVVINCSAMPETLFESELFGYKRGAFTGASNDKSGLIEMADTGTAFLDEVGEIPLATQVKLLRVLQEGEFRRVGDTVTRHVDIRILAATNRDLSGMVSGGKFREDLYYRLNVISLTVPALRERVEDIPLLAYHFLKKMDQKTSRAVSKISVDALAALQNYSWPGNVRELENVMERAVILSESDTIVAKNLPPKILSTTFYATPSSDGDLSDLSYREAKKRALNIFNRSYIINLLKKTEGNISAAAEKAGMDRSNFKKIIRKYRIQGG